MKTPQPSTNRFFVKIYKPSWLTHTDKGDNALIILGRSSSFIRDASTGYFLKIIFESSINFSDIDISSSSDGIPPSVIITDVITSIDITGINKHVDITIIIVRFLIELLLLTAPFKPGTTVAAGVN
jgi:hypothetical protein